MKRYNIINNSLGWLCFVVAALTYILTLEPTASFWDCPEFILQAFKLEVGHPPGNPIFMLAGRFFVNFAGGDISKVAYCVNLMSALLSAGTILLLFWTVTHLVKRLTVRDDATEVSPLKMIVIFGSGLCAALVYTWSDTFWFSAVEGEVYAFSSFCTALVFWLILKWENRADQPHSDRYLILIAYVIGISIAVHLLNLLCIPAIVLVVYYRKWRDTSAKGSLLALLVSCAIVALILYGLVPGFIEIAQYFELFCVNLLGWSFNMGTLAYTVIFIGVFCWAIRELYAQRSATRIRISFLLAITLSGMLFIGDNLWVALILTAALALWLFKTSKLPVRVLNLVAISTLVIFVGYSSYALLLIRSSAHTPMNQNAPDNLFSLASYLNREQYGDRPLFYGATLNSSPVYEVSGQQTNPIIKEGPALYAKKVKTSPDEPDEYIMTGHKKSYEMTPELNMLFPRIYSSDPSHKQAYADWIGFRGKPVNATLYVDKEGNPMQQTMQLKPTMAENLDFFLVYQLNHMYWRYFMWNFAGRQNDIQGNGEVNRGNWISGIPFIDNARLGDQSLLPADQGSENKGHNVFYMLPLLLGIIGIGWQAFVSKRGIEQFWVVFFLFFMTGIAIVLYLNQTPGQPRERDYAFAGSFYAFSIWVGMGVVGLWRLIMLALRGKHGAAQAAGDGEAGIYPAEEQPGKLRSRSMAAAVVAAAVGLLVPLQMVSQTWDDHDRSGRYTTRDFGNNYLNSLDENAIVFTNGDNDTFPLWYAQEVEGTRTDVKVVNLSYLTTDWYVDQVRRPSYEAPGIDMQARPADYAYDRLQFAYFLDNDTIPVDALASLRQIYSPESRQNSWGLPIVKHPNMYVPVDTAALVAAGRITPQEALVADAVIPVNLLSDPHAPGERGMTLSKTIALDMIATSAANGWNRPVYFAMTVPERYYMGLSPYMRNNGLAYEVGPLRNSSDAPSVNTEKMYRNVTERWAWGGLDKLKDADDIYLDETVRRMVTTHRTAMLDLVTALINEGIDARRTFNRDSAMLTALQSNELRRITTDSYQRARTVLDLMREKLPAEVMPYAVQVGKQAGDLYLNLGELTGNKADTEKGLQIIRDEIMRFADNIVYYQSLSPWQYSTLPYSDRYTDQRYFLDLIQSYLYGGGDVEALEKEISAKGVDLERQFRFNSAQKGQ
ncbi:glycosyltransferase family 117 protein [Paramuribaculum intestinale]|uniref:glycosyltransferase family 117 protein n=1 Tax=Paramuribaculum intestinale TaxID=2094151 RepID=UPI00272A2BEE|nr:DUF2723 domain-containing protein [Paramuribaculum intestinale]